jgi:hypothetical protein
MSFNSAFQRQCLLLLFDAGSTQVQTSLVRYYRKDDITVIRKETRRELDHLIPQLPETGGWRNPHTQFIVAATLFLALYRVLKAHGRSVDEIGSLIFETVEKMYNSQMGTLLRILKGRQFGDQAVRG